ncbi:TPA: hypothetical protein N0F65_010373 [Lagenidium giganteum]|uniref:Nuclear pore complex protein n=1 Tax=Lagenidium giganteum TaxID=4803 RepID=A0AAV2YM07_9STRA|nr:TPA: hypothetical protein N0F65_010373 [Lagenidium giganteum]
MAGGIDGAADVGEASARSERIQRLIDSADQSLSLLASLDGFGDAPMSSASAVAPGSQLGVSVEAAGNPFMASFPSSVDASMDMEASHGAVDLSLKKGMLHVKGVFPDHSVEYVDMDPRFTTIGELERAFCAKRNSQWDLGLDAADASVMFDGQVVEDDWLVVDCGMALDGVIHIVKTPGRLFSSTQLRAPQAATGDPKLSISSITSAYQQMQLPTEAPLPPPTTQISMAQADAFARNVRPEENTFAEMVSDFYGNLKNVHDMDAFCEKLLRGYIDVLQGRLEHLEDANKGVVSERLQAELEELRHERNTWRLLFELRRICTSTTKKNKDKDDDDAMLGDDQVDHLSFEMLEDDAMRVLELQNENYRIQMAVKTWLENMAVEKVFSIGAKRGSSTARTLKALKMKLFGEESSQVQLDPDAIFRNGDALLVEDDAEDEAELLKAIWRFVRAGRVQDAVDLCIRVGESWRAASISGGCPVGASETNERKDDVLERWGNPFRATWKTMCWKVAEQQHTNMTKGDSIRAREYEQLIYAALSGNVQVVTQSALCENWEDHCWAYLQGMMEQERDEILYKLLQVKQQSSKLIVGNNANHLRLFANLLDKTKNLKRYQVNLDHLFEDLKNSKCEPVRTQAHEPYRHIQAKLVTARIDYIVSTIFDALLFDMEDDSYDWDLKLDSNAKPDSVPPQFLRFAAHFIMFMGSTGEKFDDKASHMIVKLYIRHLVKHGQLQLVPIYASRLPAEGCIEVCAQVMCLVESSLEREMLLKRVLEYSSMDVLSSTLLVAVDRLWSELRDQAQNSHHKRADVVTEIDRKRMRVLEYLCFYNEHRGDALFFASALAREFAREGKFSAIKKLFEKQLPEDSIGVVSMHRDVQTRDEVEIERSIRSVLAWKAFVRATNQYDLWRGCVATSSVWSVYSEEKDFLTELMYHVSRTSSSLLDALHFENGWMIGCTDTEDGDEEVRQLCLPQLVQYLHFVQFESALIVMKLKFYPEDAKTQLAQPLLEKSLEVANVVADEHYAVYRSLSPEHCQTLLKQLQESSIALLFVRGTVDPDATSS